MSEIQTLSSYSATVTELPCIRCFAFGLRALAYESSCPHSVAPSRPCLQLQEDERDQAVHVNIVDAPEASLKPAGPRLPATEPLAAASGEGQLRVMQ